MTSIEFSNPEFLLFLLAIPLLVVTHLYLYKFTKKKAWLFSNLETLKRVSKNHTVTKNLGSLAIRILAITCIILAAAGATIHYQGEAQPSDYVLLLDASASMTAADLEPTRFEAAREAAINFVEGIEGRARFGVVSYAGYTSIHQPLQISKEQTTNTLRGIELRSISGTDPAAAIITSTNLLSTTGQGRVIILLSDGLNTAFLAEENPLEQAANYARENAVTIHAIGIGEQGSAPVGYLPSIYNVTASYHPENLEYLTQATNGRFLEANTNELLEERIQELLQDPYSREQTLPLSVALLFSALLLLFIEWGLANTRYRLIP